MIWHGGRSDLYFATGTTKQAPYATGTNKKARGCTGKEYRQKVLAEYFLPHIKERIIAGGNGSFYFVQDGAKIHTAKLTQDMLREWIGNHWLDDWPPNSCDLNPIEHVWNWIKDDLSLIHISEPTRPY